MTSRAGKNLVTREGRPGKDPQLTKGEVIAIRQSKTPAYFLAIQYGVSKRYILLIQAGKRRKNG